MSSSPAPAPTSQSPLASAAVDPRILQANERTLLAWVRTSIGIMAFGFVVARMGVWLRHLDGSASAGLSGTVVLGTGAIVLGAVVSGVAALRFRCLRAAYLRGEVPHAGGALELGVAFGTALLGLALALYLSLR